MSLQFPYLNASKVFGFVVISDGKAFHIFLGK
jgi:hypothetical protein